jgi:hypothetical protein
MPKRWAILTAALLAAPMLAGSAAAAGTQFDGRWSVSVITNAGTCDRGYRYALHIDNGIISYDDPSVQVSGQVTSKGQVRVVLRAGAQQAVGTGRMSRDYGEGQWSGQSPTGQCSGDWQAEREANR